MNALVQPVKGLVINPTTDVEKEHNALLKKHGVTALFRRSNGKRPKTTRELAHEQLLEEQKWEADDES